MDDLLSNLVLKLGQNKKSQLHRFLNTFLQLVPEKRYSKNGAAGKNFQPFLFCDGFITEGGVTIAYTKAKFKSEI